MRSWIIGSNTDCDLVVDSPLASGRHCELTRMSGGFVLHDLGSTNGTYVNGLRIAAPTPLNAGDSITLGRTVPFPWPPELTTLVQVGRLADNDIVLDDPRVSGHHARLWVVAGFQILIEDMGSSNGTFFNSADCRVTAPTPITKLDTLYFGTLAVPAARLLAGLKEPETAAPAPPPPPPAAFTEPRPELTAGLPGWEEHRWLLAWLAQAPVLAVLIVLIFGRQTGPANWQSVGESIAATTFALALASIWLGCSLAVAELAAGQLPVQKTSGDPAEFFFLFGTRVVILATLCSVACAVLLAGVYWGSGLKGPWPAMWGVLVMTSLVSLFLGLTVSALVRNGAVAANVLLFCVLAMIALGGRIRPLPQMSLPAQLAAEAMPSRWAFEGLCLLETAGHSDTVPPKEMDAIAHHDLVDEFFPASSNRMGVKASAMALGSMLIGLAALALFISGPWRIVP